MVLSFPCWLPAPACSPVGCLGRVSSALSFCRARTVSKAAVRQLPCSHAQPERRLPAPTRRLHNSHGTANAHLPRTKPAPCPGPSGPVCAPTLLLPPSTRSATLGSARLPPHTVLLSGDRHGRSVSPSRTSFPSPARALVIPRPDGAVTAARSPCATASS